MRHISHIILILLAVQSGFSQHDTTIVADETNIPKSEDIIGYVTVECDSSGMDIFIDDMLVGQAPIKSPIPLSPGKHTVTYLHPEFIKVLKLYKEEAEYRELIKKGFKTVYVVPNETISVNLWWKPYEEGLSKRKKTAWLKTGVGLGLVAIYFSLFLTATN